jgi:lysozyme
MGNHLDERLRLMQAESRQHMLKGLDVSQWQGAINWPQVKRDGYSFAIIKASEGETFVDPDFAANWTWAKVAGLVRGAYAFTRPESGNPVGQAAHFVATVRAAGDWDDGDMAAGDFETPEGSGDESAFAVTFLSTAKGSLGFPPLAYMSQSWAQYRMSDSRLAAYPLWLACLEPETCPASIGVWPSVALQQYSWTLSVPGIDGNVDGDQLERSLDGLRALGKPPSKPIGWYVKKKCSLKSRPDHGSDVVAELPAGAVVALDTPYTPNWQHVHTSHFSGWVMAKNLGKVSS